MSFGQILQDSARFYEILRDFARRFCEILQEILQDSARDSARFFEILGDSARICENLLELFGVKSLRVELLGVELFGVSK